MFCQSQTILSAVSALCFDWQYQIGWEVEKCDMSETAFIDGTNIVWKDLD